MGVWRTFSFNLRLRSTSLSPRMNCSCWHAELFLSSHESVKALFQQVTEASDVVRLLVQIQQDPQELMRRPGLAEDFDDKL